MKCPNCGLGCMVDIVVPKYKARLKGIDFEVIDAKIRECQWCSEEVHHAKEIKRWYKILEQKLAEGNEMTDKLFQTVKTTNQNAIGFVVTVRRVHGNGQRICETYYCPEGQVQLGATRIVIGPKVLKRKAIDFRKCDCSKERKNHPYSNVCYCNNEYFYYQEKIEKSFIADNEGVKFKEVEELPDWATKDFQKAFEEKNEFKAKWDEENAPEPKEKRQGIIAKIKAFFSGENNEDK